MRSLPNDIPCNLVLVREPEQDTVPRHMRLPSYEAMTKRRDEEERRHDLLAIQRFNGNNDPHITEADCRKPKISGNTVGESAAPGINVSNAAVTREFQAGDRVRVIDTYNWHAVSVGDILTVDCVLDPEYGPNAFLSFGQIGGLYAFRVELVEAAPQQPKASPVTQEMVKQILWGDEPKADPEGWIQHDGKGMPVASDRRVECRFRDGSKEKKVAGLWHSFSDPSQSNWVHQGDENDIVAYRVVG